MGCVVLAVALAVRVCLCNRKNGKSCTGDCSYCSGKCGK
ncbi:MAG: FeoB-associated Cys-rich membrane protein [Oscillospiraceae bacterium]|nr:FeoB-associated Cys-rich membrane protein [Oscillospiraceae bacterium]